jgi:ATP diphosphatase
MLRRHPHVFGSAAERAAGARDGFWERIKDAEKRERAAAGRPAPTADGEAAGGSRLVEAGGEEARLLAGVPIALPALTRAVKLQKEAARVGFDWPTFVPVLDKLKEELGELEDAIGAAGGQKTAGDAAVAEELGDVLFVIANLARHLKIDPEASLRAANAKFVRRFRRIEELLAAAGLSPSEATLAEMERAWEEAKAEERRTLHRARG